MKFEHINRIIQDNITFTSRFKGKNEKWNKNGILDRDENDGPAFIESISEYIGEFHDTPSSVLCKYYKDGKLHRENGPAVIYSSGSEEWWVNGEKHRDFGPAELRVFNENSFRLSWYKNGLKHRGRTIEEKKLDGYKSIFDPSFIGLDHKFMYEIYEKEGPAYIEYNRGHTILYWYNNGVETRDGNGPSYMKISNTNLTLNDCCTIL